MDHEALKAGVDVPALVQKILRYRPATIAFTSKKAASLFYGRPTGKIALGRQPPLTDFPAIFVLASPSGAASGAWSLQPWRDMVDYVCALGTESPVGPVGLRHRLDGGWRTV
jgi:double-stranded uracil-DNA glycosylase